MGSLIEINDTLQLTREQGFPDSLNLEAHLKTPYRTEDFIEQVFEFHNKPGIRVYQVPPVRNFLVENRDGKWIYWGLIHIIETTHNYFEKKTSGKYTIHYLYTPEEMQQAHNFIDRNSNTKFFSTR
jgi:hypothetical protein